MDWPGAPLLVVIGTVDGRQNTTGHQRKSFCVKPLIGALPVVCPCIAVIGLGPTACNRVGQTTGGAAHDVRRGNRGSSMPSGARPGRQLESRRSGGWFDHLASATGGDRRIPLLSCGHDRVQLTQQRGSDGSWAWPRLSLFSLRLVRWVNLAA